MHVGCADIFFEAESTAARLKCNQNSSLPCALGLSRIYKSCSIDWHIQAHLGMNLKMLLGHIGGHSDQPIFTGDHLTPRGGQLISARYTMYKIRLGFFFYVKVIYFEQLFISFSVKTLLLLRSMGFGYALH